MNPEIQKELLGWLQATKAAVESGVAFAAEQIPLVLWEKILLDRAYYTFVMIAGLIFAAIVGWAIKTLPDKYKAADNASYHDCSGEIGSAIITTLLGIFSFIMMMAIFCNNTYPFLTVWFAPRLYLIEWVKDMVK